MKSSAIILSTVLAFNVFVMPVLAVNTKTTPTWKTPKVSVDTSFNTVDLQKITSVAITPIVNIQNVDDALIYVMNNPSDTTAIAQLQEVIDGLQVVLEENLTTLNAMCKNRNTDCPLTTPTYRTLRRTYVDFLNILARTERVLNGQYVDPVNFVRLLKNTRRDIKKLRVNIQASVIDVAIKNIENFQTNIDHMIENAIQNGNEDGTSVTGTNGTITGLLLAIRTSLIANTLSTNDVDAALSVINHDVIANIDVMNTLLDSAQTTFTSARRQRDGVKASTLVLSASEDVAMALASLVNAMELLNTNGVSSLNVASSSLNALVVTWNPLTWQWGVYALAVDAAAIVIDQTLTPILNKISDMEEILEDCLNDVPACVDQFMTS